MGPKYMILTWSKKKKHLVGQKPPKGERLAPVFMLGVITIKKDNFAKLPPQMISDQKNNIKNELSIKN
jgi:hypothetical protein